MIRFINATLILLTVGQLSPFLPKEDIFVLSIAIFLITYFILFIYIYIFTSQLFLKCKTLKSNKVDADVGYVVRIEINKLKTIALSIYSIYSRNCFVS